MLNKNISIQKEEIMLTYKDLIIIILFSLFLSVTFYASGILKQINFIIISIVFLVSMVCSLIIFAIIKDWHDRKHIGTLKQILKRIHPLFIKMENSYNIDDYYTFKENVIRFIPNNVETKQILKNIKLKDNIDFSSSVIKVFSVFWEYVINILIYFAFAFCFALSSGKFENFTLFSVDDDFIFVFIFVFALLQEIFKNDVEKNKLFKIQDTKSVKRMCDLIIEILEETECVATKSKTVKVQKICCKKHYNIQTRKNGVVTKKHY